MPFASVYAVYAALASHLFAVEERAAFLCVIDSICLALWRNDAFIIQSFSHPINRYFDITNTQTENSTLVCDQLALKQ